MLLGVTPLGVYALTQIPGGGDDITLVIDPGALTLTGQPVTFNASMAVANAALTLTGQPVTLVTIMAVGNATLTLTGQSTTFNVAMTIDPATLTLTGSGVDLDTITDIDPGTLTLTGQPVTFHAVLAIQNGTLALSGGEVLLTRQMPIEPGRLTLFGREIDLRKIGGGGSDRKRPKKDKVQLRHIAREIEIVGPDGLPRKVPLLEHFAPPPPPPPLVVLPVGKPLPREITAPLDLPLPALPDIGEIERHAIEARDLQDAMAAIAQIPDPVSEQITRLLEDYRDMQDIARVLAEID